ncbi:MAG TPA: hypothetical protein VE967_02345 [Gemmatimonadaceae bacterium]|nr:hypothetical protein [Gemmatimonadaceae bacterium]
MTKSADPALAEPKPLPAANACGAADALHRAAAESARLHERLGRSLELVCSDEELKHVAQLTALADEHLSAMCAAYEAAADAAPEAKTEAWWHAANTMWLAAREYNRRNSRSDAVSKLAGKNRKKLEELTMEYELERSALLGLKQAAAAYHALRPDGA